MFHAAKPAWNSWGAIGAVISLDPPLRQPGFRTKKPRYKEGM
jgi:hypothetical protein